MSISRQYSASSESVADSPLVWIRIRPRMPPEALIQPLPTDSKPGNFFQR